MKTSRPNASRALLALVCLAAGGCAGVAKVMPAPPSFLVKIELNGPYDRDIPPNLAKQLKGASLAADWGIPYLFMSVALHFESAGDEVRTLHFLDRAISEFQARKNAEGEGSAVNRKVFALYEFGRVREAYDFIRQKENEWKTAPLSAFVAHNFGHYHLMNGDYEKALSFFTQSLAVNASGRENFDLLMLRRDSELESGIATILAGYVPRMSRQYSLLELDQAALDSMRVRLDEGVAHLNRVAPLNAALAKTKPGAFTPAEVLRIMEVNTANFLGLAAAIKGEWEKAFAHLAASSRVAQEDGYRVGEIDSLFFLNQVYLLKKDITEGMKAAKRLNELADRYRLPFYQIWAKFILSRYYSGFGDAPGAVAVLKEAAAVIEKQRATIVIDQLKETYFFNRQVVFEALVETLAREGDFSSALDFAQRAKARLLVDLLAGRDFGRDPAEEALVRQEQNAGALVADLGKRLAVVKGKQGARQALESLEKSESAYRDVIVKIKRENPELSSLISAQPQSLSEIQAGLPAQTALLDYFVSDRTLYIWAVDRDKVHLERVKLGRLELRRRAAEFIAAVAARDKARTAALSQSLYDALIKPVIAFAPGERLIIVAHDALHSLPFAALSDNGKYLVESRSLSYLPGASVLEHLQKRRTPDRPKILAFGNPDLGNPDFDLPSAQAEVAEIQRRFPETVVFTRAQASKTRARQALGGDFDFIHFAVHGDYASAAPLDSGLLLASEDSSDGRLTALDVFKLRLKGGEVVLSACKSALGLSATGGEIVGLNRSFLYAGAPSVTATLWSIDDKASSKLMGFFYEEIEKKTGTAESLRRAQRRMIDAGFEPFFWAAFILTGRH